VSLDWPEKNTKYQQLLNCMTNGTSWNLKTKLTKMPLGVEMFILSWFPAALGV
jgi:hypothetical protein